ncbi:MAG: hypothetical protein IJE25_04550 [Clostridia bacterium]|nr:hypothetical protein [Clostridia bacterium]
MSLKIGLSKIDFTPPAPVSLSGQFRLRVSEGVESPLMAKVFAAEANGEQLIICACDLGGVINEFCNDVRRKVSELCSDIDTDKIIISATHIHTGPDTYPKRPLGFIEQKYLPDGVHVVANEEIPPEMWDGNKCRDYVSTCAAKAIVDAWKKRDECYFGAAFGRAVVGHCRRAIYDDGSALLFGRSQRPDFFDIEATNDSGVELLYVFDKNKRPIGALANVACPAQVVEDMKVMSSDYWGKVRDWVHRELGDDFVLVGLCSAAGDQCPVELVRRQRGTDPYYRRSDSYQMENQFEGAYEIGKRLGREIVERIPEAEAIMKNDALIINETVNIDFPLRRVSEAEYEEALAKLRAKVETFGTKAITPGQMSDIYIYAGSIKRYFVQKETNSVRGRVHIARFDDIAFASNPFELFIAFGNRIRAMSPAAQTFLIQLADGTLGYLPTKRAQEGGHYSAYVSSGNTDYEGGNLLVYKTIDTIMKMWDNK